MLVLVVCLVVVFMTPICAATVALTSTLDERQTACPGEVVTYTCSVTQAVLIDWTAEPFIGESDRLQFSRSTPAEDRVIECNDSSTVPCADLDYQATITSVGPAQGGFADMTSTFRFTASARVNGTVVECRGSTGTGVQMANSTLIVAAISSPPHIPSYTVQQYGRDSVTLTVQWHPPQYDGGAPVNYTITVSPGLSPVTTNGTSFPVTVPYNVMHTVSIVTTNCNGSSSAAMVTIPAIVNCSDPIPPTDGSIEPHQNTTKGAEIFFRCNSMFVPTERMTATCTSNGMWTPDPADLTCTFHCGSPVAPQHGSLESYTDTTEGSEVFYSCDQHQVPEGRMRAVCVRNGWTPNPADLSCNIDETVVDEVGVDETAGDETRVDEPGIKVVNCGMPNAPENGIIENIQSISTVGGAQIFFKCNPRYIPAERMRATCVSPDGVSADGTWTPDPADLVCNASTIDCGDPTLPSGVTVLEQYTTTVNSIIIYQCQQSGFAPSVPSSVCGEDERWSPDPTQVVCVMLPVSCGRPVTPDNGSIEAYQNMLEGTEIVFKCNPGFVPAGRMRAVCGADGRWNPDPATLVCTASAIVCGAPSFSCGVTMEPFSSTIVGSEIHYQCQPGFLPEGRRTLLCGGDGMWNPDPQHLCTDTSLSTAATAAITAVLCLLVAFIAGVLCCGLVTVCNSRWNNKRHSFNPASNIQKQQQQVPEYEEVDTMQNQKIELEENVAYGPVKPNQ